VAEHQKGKRVRVSGIKEILADYASEASMATSPRTDEVGIGAGEKAAMSPILVN